MDGGTEGGRTIISSVSGKKTIISSGRGRTNYIHGPDAYDARAGREGRGQRTYAPGNTQFLVQRGGIKLKTVCRRQRALRETCKLSRSLSLNHIAAITFLRPSLCFLNIVPELSYMYGGLPPQ